jgi:hypothetical protein
MQSPDEEILSSTPNASACSQIPLDILHEILLSCLPLYPTIRSGNDVISSLSRVSSTWRAAVFSSPRLWSRLLVTLHKHDDLRHCVQMVTQWFERSPTLPLSFFLNIDFEADDEDIARIHTFLVDLSSVMLRVRHFALHSRLTTELLRSFVNLEWELPQLKMLDLFSHDHLDEVNAVTFSVPLFHDASNLVEVAIGNAITWATEIDHILPWSQLTHIRFIYETSMSRWIELMNMCPLLRQCEVKIDNDFCNPSCPPNGIHRTLERLLLIFSDGSIPFLKLLSLYHLPALRMVLVQYDTEPLFDFPCPQGISALANLQIFSFNTGKKKFQRKHIKYLAEILREMVNLNELELQQTTEDFVPLYQALSFGRPEEAILPQLGTLTLWISQGSEKDKELQPLLEMVSSRSGEDTIPVGFKPLKHFVVGVPTEDIHDRMRKLFDPWVAGLPSRLQFSIDLHRSSRFHQPYGWTQRISDV